MTATSSTPIKDTIKEYCDKEKQDMFIFCGDINLTSSDKFCNMIIDKPTKREKASLFLSTFGGNPNAAYKIASTLLSNYKGFKVVVCGYCKSAGTLVALGAEELHFHQLGELGPLDVQTRKKDDFGRNSGLDMFQALNVIGSSSKKFYHSFFNEIIGLSNGAISVKSAAKIATDLSTGIYSAISCKIEPVELGEMYRAMDVAQKYGSILKEQSNNWDDSTLSALISSYPCHSFVIDHLQAKSLFKKVKVLDVVEKTIYNTLKGIIANPEDAEGKYIGDIELYFLGAQTNEQSDEPIISRENETNAENDTGPSRGTPEQRPVGNA